MEDKTSDEQYLGGGRWPWTINSWEEFQQALGTMNPRSKLFTTIKSEMVKRGHWKPAPRGPWKDKEQP